MFSFANWPRHGGQVSRETRMLWVEVETLRSQRSRLEQVKKELQRRLDTFERNNQANEDSITALVKWQNNAEGKMREDEETIIHQRKEINSCKADIFKLQPKAEVPDTEYIRLYDSLCTKISDWVYREIDRFEQGGHNIESQLQCSIIKQHPEAMFLVKEYPIAWEYFLVRSVHLVLQKNCFSEKVMLYGLPRYLDSALRTVLQGMDGLTPASGKSVALEKSLLLIFLA